MALVMTAFIFLASAGGQIALEEDSKQIVARAGDRGDPFFTLKWDLTAGGELSDIRLFDTEDMVPLIKGRLPGWRIVTDDGVEYRLANDANGAVKVYTRTGDFVEFSITAQPTAADGTQLPVRVMQRYTVYDVGSVFCEFTFSVIGKFELPGSAKAVSLRSVDLAVGLQSDAWDAIEWEQMGPDNKSTYDGQWYRLCDAPDQPYWCFPHRPVGSAALGRKGRLSNHVEFWMNHGKPISGKPADNVWAKGRYGVMDGVSGVFVSLLLRRRSSSPATNTRMRGRSTWARWFSASPRWPCVATTWRACRPRRTYPISTWPRGTW